MIHPNYKTPNWSRCLPAGFWRHRAVRSLGAISLLTLSAACTTAPKTAAVEAPPTTSFEAFMAEAGKARQEGSRIKERETYRAAAANYPTRKEPWLKLAESYFESADYGNAILAAQEVVQRDAADNVANGMLAVSGLRVSTAALGTLRQQKTTLSSDTRGQAEEIVKSLRSVLGEPILVPKPTDASVSGGNTSRGSDASSAPLRRAPATSVSPTQAARPTPAAKPPAAAASAAAGNPFDRLR